jgi:hypothetical protein
MRGSCNEVHTVTPRVAGAVMGPGLVAVVVG